MIIIINLYQPRTYYIGIYFLHITYHLIYLYYYILLYLYLYSLYIYRVFRAFPSILPRRARKLIPPTIIHLCNALYAHIIIYYYLQCIFRAIPCNYTRRIIFSRRIYTICIFSIHIFALSIFAIYILSPYITTPYCL